MVELVRSKETGDLINSTRAEQVKAAIISTRGTAG